MKNSRPVFLLSGIPLALALLAPSIYAAQAPGSTPTPTPVQSEGLVDSGLPARQLVETHCTACHLAPRPAELPKEFWPTALYWMSHYVGMQGVKAPELKILEHPEPNPDLYAVFHKVANKDGKTSSPYIYYDFIQNEPLMTTAEWLRIKNYFLSNAPSQSQLELRRPKPPILTGFKAVIPKLDLEPNGWVLTTAVDAAHRRLFVGRAAKAGEDGALDFESPKDLLLFDLDTGKRLAETPLQSLPIELEVTRTGARLSTHGLFYITRSQRGISQIIDWDVSGKEPRVRMLVNGLERLTQHHSVDMNGDGRPDIVASAYGDGIGDQPGGLLAVFWQTDKYDDLWRTAKPEIPRDGPLKGALEETILNQTAGLISSAVADFNGDGLPDIAAMVAQGHQQIIVYTNNGDKTFTEHVVAELGPAAGGNSIKVGDFDGDGRPDIVAFYGDGPSGGEVEPGSITVAKPDHGIRIFQNRGNLKFEQKMFYRLPGAARGVVGDFDGDGRPDIAAIALYPDWSHKEPETFVYLHNKGKWAFSPSSLSSDDFGVWSSIEVADVNGDGKPDIVLGLANGAGFVPANWIDRAHMAGGRRNAPSVMFLVNQNK